ncbi:DUF6009 family protein [Streptomyces vinaceus]|uniref:DUF6009 family protein n=1 Tax=Streptomyces vinaceus TaxID=1960 RepID=UPI0037F574A8
MSAVVRTERCASGSLAYRGAYVPDARPWTRVPPRTTDGRVHRAGRHRRGRPDGGPRKRRVFCLLPRDRDSEPNGLYTGGMPGRAAGPRTIGARQVGQEAGPVPARPTTGLPQRPTRGHYFAGPVEDDGIPGRGRSAGARQETRSLASSRDPHRTDLRAAKHG